MWKGMDGLAIENGALKAAWQSFCMAEPQLERCWFSSTLLLPEGQSFSAVGVCLQPLEPGVAAQQGSQGTSQGTSQESLRVSSYLGGPSSSGLMARSRSRRIQNQGR